MGWAIVAGGIISAAGSIYAARGVGAANGYKKQQLDINSKTAELNALAALNDKKDQLANINASIINSTMASNTGPGMSASVSAILNKNNDNMSRESKLSKLGIDTQKTSTAMEKQMLDMQSKDAMTAGYINAGASIFQAWGTKSMLGGKSVPTSKTQWAGDWVSDDPSVWG